MEENIEVKVVTTYYDLEKNKDIECGRRMWLTEKRARQLFSKGIIKIIQIKKN